MDKKLIIYICLGIIVIGTILTLTVGLNVGLQYKESTRIQLLIGKDMNMNEIKEMMEEIFGSKVIINTGDEFKDILVVTVVSASDEQINMLVEKTNEKYELENTASDIVVVHVPAYRIRDIAKPYIVPAIISVCLVTVYFLAMYRKKEVVKLCIYYVVGAVIICALFISMLAITRIPVTALTMPIGVVLMIIYTIVSAYKISEAQ